MEQPILIQGAMESEISYLKEKIYNIKKVQINGYDFYQGELEGKYIVISKTGVGIISTTIATILGIQNFNPKCIINQGIAGSSSQHIHCLDIVIGEYCIPINSYITPTKLLGEGSNSLEWELIHFQEGIDKFEKWEADKKLVELAKNNTYNQGKIWIGNLGSGDCWNKEIDRIKWFNVHYKILCEDMETIASYTVCNQFKCPVLGIRAISDNAITGEEYDKAVAVESQKFTIKLCKLI